MLNQRTADGMKEMIALLDRHRIPFLPLPPNEKAKASDNLGARGLEPLSVGTLSGMTGRVIHIKGCNSGLQKLGSARYNLIYLNGSGMLEAKTCDRTDVTGWDDDAAVLGILKPEQLSKANLQIYESEMRKHGPTVKTLNIRVKLPDICDGILLEETKLKMAVGFAVRSDCLSYALRPDMKQDFQQHIGLGNALAAQGITVLDYIRAEYSMRVLPYAYDHAIWGKNGELHPACLEALGPYARPRDPWPESERIPEIGDIHPDPMAYCVLTKICQPRIRRQTGNTNRKTFDFAQVDMCIRSLSTMPDRKDIIDRYQTDLMKIAILRLAQDNSFCNYDVPLNFLRCTRMTITRDDRLEIQFELKQIQDPKEEDGI